MRKAFLIIVIIIFNFVSCQKKENIIEKNIIDKLAEGSYKSTSVYGYISLFVLTDDNEIIETNSAYLYYVYEHHYTNSFKNFNSFLTEVLNEKIKLHKINFDRVPYKSFRINKEIEMKYKTQNFNVFFKEYVKSSESTKDKYFLRIDKLNNNEIMSVSYFLYKNGYQIKIDDVRAQYRVVKRDVFFK